MGLFKIDGVTVVAPNRLVCSNNIVSRSYEDANAIFRDMLIREKRVVKWVYSNISKSEFQLIFDTVWNNKIRKIGSRMFNITSDYPGEGSITSVFYLGTPTNFESIKSTKINGVEVWSLEMEWIEKVGITLLSPNRLPE